jgi:hypothetical protein
MRARGLWVAGATSVIAARRRPRRCRPGCTSSSMFSNASAALGTSGGPASIATDRKRTNSQRSIRIQAHRITGSGCPLSRKERKSLRYWPVVQALGHVESGRGAPNPGASSRSRRCRDISAIDPRKATVLPPPQARPGTDTVKGRSYYRELILPLADPKRYRIANLETAARQIEGRRRTCLTLDRRRLRLVDSNPTRTESCGAVLYDPGAPARSDAPKRLRMKILVSAVQSRPSPPFDSCYSEDLPVC